MSSVSVPKNDGVSPIIGTILLVALTAILVGIVGAVLMGFASPEPAPILGISIVQQGNITTITHLNGAVLPAGKFKILVDGVDKTAAFGGTGDFGPGMKLSWDSGAEKVGTVSVVYTGETGTSMLIADKKIGKTGSGGSTDLSILSVGGKTYNLPLFNGQWSEFKEIANNTISGMNIPGRKILYQDGKYWFVYDPNWLSKVDASNSAYTVQDFNTHIITDTPRWYPCLIEVLKNEHVLTSADFSSGTTFKPGFLPLKLGKLYTDGSNLYMYNLIGANPLVTINYFTPSSTWDWVKIGTVSSP